MGDTSTPNPSPRFTLRQLPLAARLLLAVFFVAVGVGYFAAMLNLRFQEGKPGDFLPSKDDVVRIYHGDGRSQLERLLEAHPGMPFNGQGSMRAAFTKQYAAGWEAARERVATKYKLNRNDPKELDRIDRMIGARLDGERRALLAWVKGDPDNDVPRVDRGPYENDRFLLTGDLATMPISRSMREDAPDGKRYAKVRSILEVRCVRCHDEKVGGSAGEYPLRTYSDVSRYGMNEGPTGKSVQKLALSSHVHLLGTTILFGLTGLAFAFTSLPGLIRAFVAPLPLLGFLLDIAFQWLARLEGPTGETFAQGIMLTGGLVGAGLGLQVILALFSMFGWGGRLVLLVLMILTAAGGHYAKVKYLDPLLNQQTDDFKNENLEPSEPKAPPPGVSTSISHLERLLEAPEDLPFNGEGTMRSAFTTHVGGRVQAHRRIAAEKKLDLVKDQKKIEAEFRRQLEGERKALVYWVSRGLKKKPYDEDSMPIPPELAKEPITPEFLVMKEKTDDAPDAPDVPVGIKVKSIFRVRCARCHGAGVGGLAARVPLEKYEQIRAYAGLPPEGPRAVVPPPKRAVSELERILEAPEGLPFNGEGTMRPAFGSRVRDKGKLLSQLARETRLKRSNPKVQAELERRLEVERQGLLAWARSGASKEAFENDRFVLSGALARSPVNADVRGDVRGVPYLKVKTLIDRRCGVCHCSTTSGPGARMPFDTYEDVAAYITGPRRVAHAAADTRTSGP